MKREGGPALIVQHCAVFGRLETPVRLFKVNPPAQHGPHAQYPVTVTVVLTKPRKRIPNYFTVRPDNLRYATIEEDGDVVYDSRAEVPCDMAAWEQTWARFKKSPPATSRRRLPDGSEVVTNTISGEVLEVIPGHAFSSP